MSPKLRAQGSELNGPPRPRWPITSDLRQEPGALAAHAGICAGGTRLNRMGLPIEKDNFRLASENGAVAWEMVKHGLGIGLMAADVADRTPGVVCVLPDLDPIPVPVWLVTHRELHTSRRIRLVFDVLAETLGKRRTWVPIMA